MLAESQLLYSSREEQLREDARLGSPGDLSEVTADRVLAAFDNVLNTLGG